MAAVLGGHVTVGVNGYQEFAAQLAAGKLRPLAISSDQRVPGIDIPTFKEQGIDVSLVNWRGVLAPPQIKEADLKSLSDTIAKMVQSTQWKETPQKRAWIDLYLPAGEFKEFLAKDRTQVESLLKEVGLVK